MGVILNVSFEQFFSFFWKNSNLCSAAYTALEFICEEIKKLISKYRFKPAFLLNAGLKGSLSIV